MTCIFKYCQKIIFPVMPGYLIGANTHQLIVYQLVSKSSTADITVAINHGIGFHQDKYIL